MNRDTTDGMLARVVCDKAAGIVYVNDVPVDGYIVEDGIEVNDVANPNSIMQVVLSIFAESVGNTTVQIGTHAGIDTDAVGVCYLALPTMNRDMAGKVIGMGT